MAFVGQILLSSAIFFAFALILFLPVERLLPARVVREPAPASDWLHFLINPALSTWFALTVLAFVGGAIRASLPHGFSAWVEARPLWLQLLATVILAELWSYWAHRLSHTVPFLWRLHRVHHSIEEMSWVSAHRQHPLDALWILAGANLPAFALGIDLNALAWFILLERCYTVLLHTNIDFTYGWLDRIFSSPRFHHWHHDAGEEGRNRNFAGMFSCLDWIFGTWHSPAVPPKAFGRRSWRGGGIGISFCCGRDQGRNGRMKSLILPPQKGSSQFYVKLLLLYVWSISLVPSIDDLCNWDNCEAFAESWNPWLEWDLVLSGLFLPALALAIVYFRRMPFFCGGFVLLATWHIYNAIGNWWSLGFDSRMDIGLDPVGFLRVAFTFALPFGLVILLRFIWLRKRT